MKNLVFALQVFAVIVFLPAYVIVEMNHATATVQETRITAPAAQEVGATNAGMDIALVTCPLASAIFNNVPQKVKKDHNNGGCSCTNCSCGSACLCGDL